MKTLVHTLGLLALSVAVAAGCANKESQASEQDDTKAEATPAAKATPAADKSPKGNPELSMTSAFVVETMVAARIATPTTLINLW